MPVLNTQISESTNIILNRLVKNLSYTKRLIIEIAVREFYQSESQLRKEPAMSPSNLFELFVGHGVSTKEIAQMDLKTIKRQVGEMRADEPDSIEMTDAQIAQAIHGYAQES